jgi:glycosyltransferase involved in cell wall biosynthesis
MESMERDVVHAADAIIAASDHLRARLQGFGRDSSILTHGVSLEHWSAAGSPPPEMLSRYERPLIMFWGLIDRRIDVDMVLRTATALKQGTILLVGPHQDPNADLWKSNRVVPFPAQDYDKLPSLAQAASVLIMPYADLSVTRAMQPLKLKEYLATGKAAVVADLPAVREWSDCLDIAKTPDEFSAAVRLRIQTGLPDSQRLARRRLADECWTAKARCFEELLEGPSQASAFDIAPRFDRQGETTALTPWANPCKSMTT